MEDCSFSKQWELLGCAPCLMHGWGNRGVLSPLPRAFLSQMLPAHTVRMCGDRSHLPALAAQLQAEAKPEDSHDAACMLPTLVHPVCPQDWILLCLEDPGSPASLPTRSLPLASPTGQHSHLAQAQAPDGAGAGSRRDGPASDLASRSLAASPLPRAVWSKTRASQWD